MKMQTVVLIALIVCGCGTNTEALKDSDNDVSASGQTDTSATRQDNASMAPAKTALAAPYTHFLFVQYGPQGRGSRLTLASVTEESVSSRDIYLGNAEIPLCVVNGVAYETYPRYQGQLSAVDLATGVRRYIVPGTPKDTAFDCAGARIFAALRTGEKEAMLRVYDLSNQTYRDLLTIPQWRRFHRLTASPDGKRVAYFGYGKGNGWQLRVVDVRTSEVEEAGPPIRFRTSPLASWSPAYPPHVWADEKTLLAASQESTETRIKLLARAQEALGRKKPLQGWERTRVSVTAIDTATGKYRRIGPLAEKIEACRITLYMPSHGCPTLTRWYAGLERYRVDLASSRLVPVDDPPPLDEHSGGDFRFGGHGRPPGVYHKDKLLEGPNHIAGMGSSPDGRSAVWASTDSARGPDRYELRYCNADEGIVRTIEGARPIRDRVLWLTEADLAPRKIAPSEPADGWKAFSLTDTPSPSKF